MKVRFIVQHFVIIQGFQHSKVSLKSFGKCFGKNSATIKFQF